LLAGVLVIAPGAPPAAVARFTNAFCLALTGALFTILSFRLGVRSKLSGLAGLTVSLSPVLVYLSASGMSEVSFVMVLAAGLVGVLVGGAWTYCGAVALGIAPLIRTNFVLVPLVVILLIAVLLARRRLSFRQVRVRQLAACCILASAPSLLWACRNYLVTGHFPLLSSGEGEVLWGSNNDVVANELATWGYWVQPDDIPNESPKILLATVFRNDLAQNEYYHRKAVTWIGNHLAEMPRLILGKLVRAFAPVPWVPRPESYGVFLYRFALIATGVLLAPLWIPRIAPAYLLILVSMFVVHLLTTVIYYGLFRFTHCFVEIPLVPCIFLGFQQWRDRRKPLSRLPGRQNDAGVSEG
jgi:4-amino-4-deoxy-L-arabinose transferase-like glycosyltransferase